MSIELNNNNCKEYTTEELEAKLAEMQNEEVAELEVDLDLLFSLVDDEDIVLEGPKALTAFQIKTLECLDVAKKELAHWEAKEYKQGNGSVWVGGELEGKSVSYNYINNSRKRKMIKNAQSDVTLYTNDLINSGYKF